MMLGKVADFLIMNGATVHLVFGPHELRTGRLHTESSYDGSRRRQVKTSLRWHQGVPSHATRLSIVLLRPVNMLLYITIIISHNSKAQRRALSLCYPGL